MLALCTLVVVGGLVLSDASALASGGYKQRPGPAESFLPTPTGVAVDNSGTSSDGDVYVVDGTTTYQFLAGSELREQVELPNRAEADRVAVDSSDTASSGNVYVTVPTGGAIDKLDMQLVRSSSSPLVEGLTSPTGIAVDAAGNVYVAQWGMGNVLEFSSSGAPLNGGKPVVQGLVEPEGIAVDSRGDLYVAEDNEPGTVEFTPTGTGGFSAPRTIDSKPAFDVAVDSSTGDVFIAGDETVEVLDSSGSKIGVALGSKGLLLNDYRAVGESEATGDVFAINANDDALDAAEPEGLPESPITEACTVPMTAGALSLCGTLNPHGSAKAGFYFAYSKGASCKDNGKTPLEPESEGEGIKVSGPLTGLEPGVQYTYCLVATNPQGATFGQAISFTTQAEAGKAPETPSTTPSLVIVATLPATTLAGNLSLPSTNTTTPKVLTNAQKLANALKLCKRKPRKRQASCEKQARTQYVCEHKPRKRRASCETQARKRYGVTTRTKSEQSSKRGQK